MSYDKIAVIRTNSNVTLIQTSNLGHVETEFFGELNDQQIDSYTNLLINEGYEVTVIDETRDEGM